MFEICSHSRVRRRTAFRLLLALAAVCAALSFPACGRAPRLETTAGRCAYLAAFGCTADPASEELSELDVPTEFDAIWENYNALQLAQGFDLREAAGRRCLRASYDLVGWPNWDGRVIATLYLYRGRVIGADVHTASAEGFLRPLR